MNKNIQNICEDPSSYHEEQQDEYPDLMSNILLTDNENQKQIRKDAPQMVEDNYQRSQLNNSTYKQMDDDYRDNSIATSHQQYLYFAENLNYLTQQERYEPPSQFIQAGNLFDEGQNFRVINDQSHPFIQHQFSNNVQLPNHHPVQYQSTIEQTEPESVSLWKNCSSEPIKNSYMINTQQQNSNLLNNSHQLRQINQIENPTLFVSDHSIIHANINNNNQEPDQHQTMISKIITHGDTMKMDDPNIVIPSDQYYQSSLQSQQQLVQPPLQYYEEKGQIESELNALQSHYNQQLANYNWNKNINQYPSSQSSDGRQQSFSYSNGSHSIGQYNQIQNSTNNNQIFYNKQNTISTYQTNTHSSNYSTVSTSNISKAQSNTSQPFIQQPTSYPQIFNNSNEEDKPRSFDQINSQVVDQQLQNQIEDNKYYDQSNNNLPPQHYEIEKLQQNNNSFQQNIMGMSVELGNLQKRQIRDNIQQHSQYSHSNRENILIIQQEDETHHDNIYNNYYSDQGKCQNSALVNHPYNYSQPRNPSQLSTTTTNSEGGYIFQTTSSVLPQKMELSYNYLAMRQEDQNQIEKEGKSQSEQYWQQCQGEQNELLKNTFQQPSRGSIIEPVQQFNAVKSYQVHSDKNNITNFLDIRQPQSQSVQTLNPDHQKQSRKRKKEQEECLFEMQVQNSNMGQNNNDLKQNYPKIDKTPIQYRNILRQMFPQIQEFIENGLQSDTVQQAIQIISKEIDQLQSLSFQKKLMSINDKDDEDKLKDLKQANYYVNIFYDKKYHNYENAQNTLFGIIKIASFLKFPIDILEQFYPLNKQSFQNGYLNCLCYSYKKKQNKFNPNDSNNETKRKGSLLYKQYEKFKKEGIPSKIECLLFSLLQELNVQQKISNV